MPKPSCVRGATRNQFVISLECNCSHSTWHQRRIAPAIWKRLDKCSCVAVCSTRTFGDPEQGNKFIELLIRAPLSTCDHAPTSRAVYERLSGNGSLLGFYRPS